VQRGVRNIGFADTEPSISIGGYLFNNREQNSRSTTNRNAIAGAFFSGQSTMRSRRTSFADNKSNWNEQQSIGFSDNQIDKILTDA
jgi:hypothetical protein